MSADPNQPLYDEMAERLRKVANGMTWWDAYGISEEEFYRRNPDMRPKGKLENMLRTLVGKNPVW
jgi:hypothetical protein